MKLTSLFEQEKWQNAIYKEFTNNVAKFNATFKRSRGYDEESETAFSLFGELLIHSSSDDELMIQRDKRAVSLLRYISKWFIDLTKRGYKVYIHRHPWIEFPKSNVSPTSTVDEVVDLIDGQAEIRKNIEWLKTLKNGAGKKGDAHGHFSFAIFKAEPQK